MKKLLLFGFGQAHHYCKVDDGGDNGGGGGGASGGDNGGTGGDNGGTGGDNGGTGGDNGGGGGGVSGGDNGGGGGDNGGQGGDNGGTGGDVSGGDKGGEGKPYLGDKGGQGDGNQPTPATDEDYEKALVKDVKLLGDDKSLQLDTNLYKAVIPIFKEHGVKPEVANALANALAKAQIDDSKARMQSRLDYFQKMKDESMRTYTQGDFEIINAGIDKWFKPSGIMNRVIRNSELGADPEFLALMHHVGKAAKEDGAAGAAAGGGGQPFDPGGEQGLSDIW